MPVRATMPRAAAGVDPSSVGVADPSASGGTDALRGRRLDEDQVLGRVEVDRERRRRQLDDGDAGRLGESPVRLAARGTEGDVDHVGRPQDERVGPRPVPVRDEDDGPGAVVGEGREDRVDRLGRHEREVGRKDEDRLGATGDDIVTAVADAGVEAAAPLTEGPGPETRRHGTAGRGRG